MTVASLQHDKSGALLAGVTVIEYGEGVPLAAAGRHLATLGAVVIKVERPRSGDWLRYEPPLIGRDSYRVGALFTFLNVNKFGITLDASTPTGRDALSELLATADLLLESDGPMGALDVSALRDRQPDLLVTSISPFGRQGPRARYKAAEINLLHSSGEGFLLPNGLAFELFPDRAPVKAYGHMAELQGGLGAAVAAVAGLLSRRSVGAQSIDVSIQDVNVALSGMNIQRYGDGVLETRASRSFTYGGVLECQDGCVEILTLEHHQWVALVKMMGDPEWAATPEMSDPLNRGRMGEQINRRLRAWAKDHSANELVRQAQAAGVPMAKFMSPSEVLGSEQEQRRGSFRSVDVPGAGQAQVLAAAFKVDGRPLELTRALGAPGADNHLVWNQGLNHSDEELDAWVSAGVI